MDFFSLKRNEMCKKLSSNEVSFLPRKDSPDERFNIISDLSGANSSKPFRRSFKQRQDCGHAIRLHQSICCFYLHGANQASKFSHEKKIEHYNCTRSARSVLVKGGYIERIWANVQLPRQTPPWLPTFLARCPAKYYLESWQ